MRMECRGPEEPREARLKVPTTAGTLYEMEMDEALAVLALVATDPSFPSFVSDAERQAFVAEARRTVEAAAHECADACLSPACSRCSCSGLRERHDAARRCS
jgi:hypothetical protein